MESGNQRPFKISDSSGTKRYGIVAATLNELKSKACKKLNYEISKSEVVLEDDGTVVDEEDYFQTLEKNTVIVILNEDEEWSHKYQQPSQKVLGLSEQDAVDGALNEDIARRLITRLQGDIGHMVLLSGAELEVLSEINVDVLRKYFPDRVFLEGVKEASMRHLTEKRDACDALHLLKKFMASSGKPKHSSSDAASCSWK